MEGKTTRQPSSSSQMWERLEAFVREQGQRFIQALLEEEVTSLVGRAKLSRRAGVDVPEGMRNGYGKPRGLTLTTGMISVRRPRVRGLSTRFVSRVLPLFKGRTCEVGALLPQRYLHGLVLGDFDLALRGMLGDAAPLSPASLVWLKAQWQVEYATWKHRRLEDLAVVYVWADGLYVKAGQEVTKAALLVLIGALTTGQKVVLAVESRQRESKGSWGVSDDVKMHFMIKATGRTLSASFCKYTAAAPAPMLPKSLSIQLSIQGNSDYSKGLWTKNACQCDAANHDQ